MASTLKFVDSIASSPTLRLDLNDRTTWRSHVNETTFPPPPLRQAITQTLLADGAVIPAAAYDLRTIHLTLSVGGTADAVATPLQTLFRELDRPQNILQLQQETTNPIFFRTFRTSPESVTDLGKIDGTRKTIAVDVLAEPFGYGLMETPINAATLNRDPANGSNGTFVDVTGVKGDVETPALMKMTAGVTNRETLLAVRRRGTPSSSPYLFQAEALTQGTDTTTQANDANFSGAGNNYSRCTFGTTAMTTRLTLSDLGTAGVNLRGRYRVYLRYRKNTSGDSITMQLVWGTSGGTTTTNALFTTPAATTLCMADLGEIQVPRGWDPVYDGKSGVELSVLDTFHAALQIRRISGASTIDLDFLLFVPSDDRVGIYKTSEVPASLDHWVLDAEDTSISARDASALVVSAAYPSVSGGFPYLSPNQTNRIYVVHEIAAGLSYGLTTQSITVRYYPRYLYIRPSAT